jgi:hypothetical protein
MSAPGIDQIRRTEIMETDICKIKNTSRKCTTSSCDNNTTDCIIKLVVFERGAESTDECIIERIELSWSVQPQYQH